MKRHRPGRQCSPRGRAHRADFDAATRILIDEGYAELSTRKIAARAWIRTGHLQCYYPTKQDVVRGLLERYLERATIAFGERLASTAPTPEGRLEAALDGILRDQADGESARFFFELWALAARDPAVAEAMQGFYRASWRTPSTRSSHRAALGRPRAERRAALLIAMLEGLSLFRSRTTRELPLPALERELRSLVRRLATDLG